MDPRTIGQILASPEWLRQTLGEERPIQQNAPQVAPPPVSYTATPTNIYAAYQGALPVEPSRVPTRPDSEVVEVRGTIAFTARYRAEYFDETNQQQMISLAQSVISGDTGVLPGEIPPPWLPEVQFWIRSFERIGPYANAQAEELERLRHLKAQAAAFEQQQRELDRHLTFDEKLYGPASVIREGVAARAAAERENGWEPGPIPGSRPDWVGDVFRDIFERLDQFGERLEAMERRDDGAPGTRPAVPPDDGDHRDADRGRGPEPDQRDADPGAGGGGDPGVHAAAEAGDPEPDAGGAVRDRAPERGRAERTAGPRQRIDHAKRKAAIESA